jgi:hypothetical protein
MIREGNWGRHNLRKCPTELESKTGYVKFFHVNDSRHFTIIGDILNFLSGKFLSGYFECNFII